MGKRLWMMLAVCLSAVSMVFAQKTVTGRVFDQSTGEAVVGASVIVTGSNIGAATNMDGDFTIHNVPANAKTLKVSYIGMKTAEVAIKSKIRVYLEPQQTEMDEVLVVAYGTQKRSAYTGAASEIKAEQIDNRQFANATQALVGTMAGVQTYQPSGKPGSSIGVRIRGISSMNGDVEPLYVLDGVPYDGDLTAINPSDIESLTVLKDAVSTALYGSRGANGVVMITTKKGKLGEAKITFDAKWGATSREIKNYDVIKDPAQYLELIYSGFYNQYSGTYSAEESNRLANAKIYSDILGGGYSNIYTLPEGQNLIGLNGKLNPNATLGGTDGTYYYRPDNWEDETFKTGFRQEYNVSLSAANDRLNYYASFGYLDDKGIVSGSEFKRFSGRVNIDYQAKDWLKIGTQTSFGHIVTNDPLGTEEGGSSSTNAFYTANNIAPVYPMYVRNAQGQRIFNDQYGHYVYDYGDGQSSNGKRVFMSLSNPASDYFYNYDENVADVLNTNWFATIDFGYGFTASAKVGLNIDNTHYATTTNPVYGQGASFGGEVTEEYIGSSALTHQYLVNYINTFGRHSVNATAGFEGYRRKGQFFWGTGQNMYNPFNPTLYNVIDQYNVGGAREDNFNTAGFFFTGNYVFDQRFYANVGFRRDGTSVFAKKNRWGNFGSIGLGWNMKNESWLKDFEPLDLLKFRASFGQVGNDNHNTMLYAYTDLYRVTGSNGVFSDGTIIQKGNPDLKWEKTNSWNVGFDYSFFKGRLTGSIEYFIRKTDNMLDYRNVASSNGYTSIPVNFGSIRNNGLDFEVSYDIFRNKDFEWNVSLNFTSYKNKIVKLSPEYNGEYISGSRIYREGGSIYNLYLVQWGGVDPETGLAQYWTNNKYYYDMEGNDLSADDIEGLVEGTDYTTETKYELTSNYNAAYNTARKESGSTLPDAFGGFSTSLKWKGFDLYVQTSWQWGGKMIDSDYRRLMSTYNNFNGQNFHKNILNAWTPENRYTNVPRVNPNDQYAASLSTNFLIKSDYFSIDNITLGYTLPKTVTLPWGIELLRVFASAENVCIFSARQGLDPRMSFIQSAGSNYSARRIISGGIKLTF